MTSMVTNYLNKFEEPIKEIKDDATQLITTNDSGTIGQDGETKEPIETNDSEPDTLNETVEEPVETKDSGEPKKESKFINLRN